MVTCLLYGGIILHQFFCDYLKASLSHYCFLLFEQNGMGQSDEMTKLKVSSECELQVLEFDETVLLGTT